MRYLLLIVLVLTMTVLPTAAQEGNPQSIANGQVTFELPPGWIVLPVEDNGAVYAQDQHNMDLLNESIGRIFNNIIQSLENNILPTPTPPPVEPFVGGAVVYMEREEAEQSGLMPDILAESGELEAVDFELNGYPATRLSLQMEETPPYKTGGFIVVVDYETHILFMMNFFVAEEDLTPLLDGIVNSLKVQGKTPLENSPAQVEVEAAGGTLELVSVQSARDLGDQHLMTLSPDGAELAWASREGMCLYTFEQGSQTCTPMPENFDGQPNLLKWSPDGKFIAFYENVFRNVIESDLWLFDVENQTFINRTDDGLVGSFFRMEETAIALDYTPIWVGETLYFFRSVYGGEIVTTALYRLPSLLEGEPELVTDITGLSETPYPIYDISGDELEGTAAVSPDGEWLAVLIRPQQPENMSVALVELATGGMEIIARMDAFAGVGLPEWVDQLFYLNGVAWLPDQSGLVVSSFNPRMVSFPFTLYQLDLATLQVTALLDFSGIASESDLFIGEPVAPVFDLPRSSVMLPDGSGLLTFNFYENQMGVSQITPGSEPVRLVEQEVVDWADTPSSIGQTGNVVRVLMAGNLFTFELKP